MYSTMALSKCEWVESTICFKKTEAKQLARQRFCLPIRRDDLCLCLCLLIKSFFYAVQYLDDLLFADGFEGADSRHFGIRHLTAAAYLNFLTFTENHKFNILQSWV